jgi:nucleotide-binding universal stress UspA family protein
MSLKDILVVLDDTPQSEACLNLVARFARASDAYLIGVCPHAALLPPRFDLEPVPTLDLGFVSQSLSRSRDIAATRAERAEAVMRDTLRLQMLKGEWHDVVDDDPLDAIVGLSRRVDLVVMGQIDPERSVSASIRELPELVLLEAARPVLVVPYIGAETVPFRNVLICWNDSRAAVRAVNDALPLLVEADSVTVLAIDPGPAALDRATASDMASHLARHGVSAVARETISDGLPVADVILNHASDLGASLIVMGGYGHSRAREHLLGGATLELLRTMTVPVLMSH